MAMPTLESEFEYESESEYESEYNFGGQGEAEGEYEAEQFFNQLANLTNSPALQKLAQQLARAIIVQEGGKQSEYEFESEGEFEGEAEWESEYEFESEFEGEGEFKSGRGGRGYADAVMEHMAHAASQAESEQEAAEYFLPLIGLAAAKLLPLAAKALPLAGKLLPKAAKFLPRVFSNVNRVMPNLTRGVNQMGRMLYRNPQTRPLVRTMPTIVNRTVGSIAQQAARGGPVSPQQAMQTLARQTTRVLSNPKQCVAAYRRSRKLDGRFHHYYITINLPR